MMTPDNKADCIFHVNPSRVGDRHPVEDSQKLATGPSRYSTWKIISDRTLEKSYYKRATRVRKRHRIRPQMCNGQGRTSWEEREQYRTDKCMNLRHVGVNFHGRTSVGLGEALHIRLRLCRE